MNMAESNQIRALEVKEKGRHSEELQVVQGAWHPCEWGMLGVPGRESLGDAREIRKGQITEGLYTSNLARSRLFLGIIINSVPATH